MTRIEGTDWQRLFKALVDEADPTPMKQKVVDLETALVLRGQELESSSEGEAERKALEDAILVLLRIKAEKVGFPRDPKVPGEAGKTQE